MKAYVTTTLLEDPLPIKLSNRGTIGLTLGKRPLSLQTSVINVKDFPTCLNNCLKPSHPSVACGHLSFGESTLLGHFH